MIQSTRKGRRPRISSSDEEDEGQQLQDILPVKRAKHKPFEEEDVKAIRSFLEERKATSGKVSMQVCREFLEKNPKMDRTPKQIQDKIKQPF